MVVQLKWPWLGIAIPSFLISFIGYGSHYFVFQKDFSFKKSVFLELCVTMIWISYIIAIKKDPGSPPKNFQPMAGEWRRWCKKCENYKPERTHHCKTCKKCVLKMDHHCPWTYNCVGHANLPHFLRFLLWVIFTTGFILVELVKKAMVYYKDRNLPSYLVSVREMFFVCLLIPMDFFVLLTISILAIRCFYNILSEGMTQIESWESERIESQLENGRIWKQIRKNYLKLHGKQMPKLVSWSTRANIEGMAEDDNNGQDPVTEHFSIDDLVFPYDLGMVTNLIDSFGYPWNWLLPWGTSRGDGIHFKKNEYMEDDQLGLPWPPDGGHQEKLTADEIAENLSNRRRRRDFRINLGRTEWMNDMGEKLHDFGVDIEAEDEENDDLLAKLST